MHFHPGLYQVSLPIELVDFDLEVERTEVQPMVPSVGSRIADSPIVQIEVEPKIEFEPCDGHPDHGPVAGQAPARGLVPDGLDPERPCGDEKGQGFGIEVDADLPRPPVHTYRDHHSLSRAPPAWPEYTSSAHSRVTGWSGKVENVQWTGPGFPAGRGEVTRLDVGPAIP